MKYHRRVPQYPVNDDKFGTYAPVAHSAKCRPNSERERVQFSIYLSQYCDTIMATTIREPEILPGGRGVGAAGRATIYCSRRRDRDEV